MIAAELFRERAGTEADATRATLRFSEWSELVVSAAVANGAPPARLGIFTGQLPQLFNQGDSVWRAAHTLHTFATGTPVEFRNLRARMVSLRHEPYHDPPAFGNVERWTCLRCGAAILRAGSNVYGAGTEPCSKAGQ